MSKLFQQSNFKKQDFPINGTTFVVSELSAGAMLDYTEYGVSCAEEMKKVHVSLPASTEEWTEDDINKAHKSLMVFRIRTRVRLVALSLKPYFNDPAVAHPLCGVPIEELEEILINELKSDQLQELEKLARKLSNVEEEASPKHYPVETSDTN